MSILLLQADMAAKGSLDMLHCVQHCTALHRSHTEQERDLVDISTLVHAVGRLCKSV